MDRARAGGEGVKGAGAGSVEETAGKHAAGGVVG